MKNILSIVVAIVVMVALSAPSFADTSGSVDDSGSYTTVTSEATYLSDGSYYVTVIGESISENISQAGNILQAASSTKTGTKRTTYYNSSGASLWYVQIKGTFTYNGTTSSCTSATVSAASQVSPWVISSKSASKSGNQATGKATAKCYNGSVLVGTVSKTVIITCSKTGTLY